MKVAILGFGVEGKDAAKYFLGKHADITVFDKKQKEELNFSGFETYPITWVLGDNYLAEGFPNFDVIVRSPGIRPDIPEILASVKNGAKLTSSTKIFFGECTKPIIGVTGTKGKGTAASLISEGLKACDKKVVLLGNIGEPMLSSLGEANKSDYVVLELSSFQTIDLHKSPHLVVVTNITVDHLDWHKDIEEYVQAKAQLWANQTKDDYLILNWQDSTSREIATHADKLPGILRRYSSIYNPECFVYIKEEWNDKEKWSEIWSKGELIGRTDELQIPGKHNVENAMAAISVLKIIDVNLSKAWVAITNFKGLEHRLENVATIDGVTYINDSYATNPEPTIAALHSFEQPKILILGGSTKGADFSKLAQEIVNSNVPGVVLIGNEADTINYKLKTTNYKGIIKLGGQTMKEIVKVAKNLAKQGDVVLLSPACASFGLFKDYKDRGKQFKEAVHNQ